MRGWAGWAAQDRVLRDRVSDRVSVVRDREAAWVRLMMSAPRRKREREGERERDRERERERERERGIERERERERESEKERDRG